MSCFHPLKGFPIGLTDNGKTQYKIVSYDVHHVECYSGEWRSVGVSDRSPYADKAVFEYVEIPCGKCVGCRIAKSREWANRCMLELQYHDSSFFVTLTYDNDHVPIGLYPDENGVACESLSLCKRDFQLFMKRLRKRQEKPIRYFACGEYGSETFRPHYHAIIFGLELDDLVPLGRSQFGSFQYYTSAALQAAWTAAPRADPTAAPSPIGHVCVSEVTWETCAYTARYIMKKLDGPLAEFYVSHGLEPEFSLMSRRPGIARQYFDEHGQEMYSFDHVSIATKEGSVKVKPPHYFDRLYDLDYPDDMSQIKDSRRRAAESLRALKLARTGLSYTELLQVEEGQLRDKIKSLKEGRKVL